MLLMELWATNVGGFDKDYEERGILIHGKKVSFTVGCLQVVKPPGELNLDATKDHEGPWVAYTEQLNLLKQ